MLTQRLAYLYLLSGKENISVNAKKNIERRCALISIICWNSVQNCTDKIQFAYGWNVIS